MTDAAVRQVQERRAWPPRESIPFQLRRLGVVMEPEPSNPYEVEGVLNPAAARGRDGQLYLFPRMVARGNYSRIGIARVLFDGEGTPVGAERLALALEPEADYELTPGGGGGCEDPRVNFLPELDTYLMSYTALGEWGPRVALAASKDLMSWRRLGLAHFEPYRGVEFDHVFNKDAILVSEPAPRPDGEVAYGLIHRPLFPGTTPHDLARHTAPRRVDTHRESIWLSHCAKPVTEDSLRNLCSFDKHHRLASPAASWERLKIGAGAPPLKTGLGWLLVYHGVSGRPSNDGHRGTIRYAAGVMILDPHDLCKVLYRSPHPVLYPSLPEERVGVVANVVFPTGADQRHDLGRPDLLDVYYGMADSRIGVARIEIPRTLPPGSLPDKHREIV